MRTPPCPPARQPHWDHGPVVEAKAVEKSTISLSLPGFSQAIRLEGSRPADYQSPSLPSPFWPCQNQVPFALLSSYDFTPTVFVPRLVTLSRLSTQLFADFLSGEGSSWRSVLGSSAPSAVTASPIISAVHRVIDYLPHLTSTHPTVSLLPLACHRCPFASATRSSHRRWRWHFAFSPVENYICVYSLGSMGSPGCIRVAGMDGHSGISGQAMIARRGSPKCRPAAATPRTRASVYVTVSLTTEAGRRRATELAHSSQADDQGRVLGDERYRH
ncbi:hypothetical protein FB45DRAFT_1027355 [Roridomyces roridus]|uniref:Uncharacterized protein n=1 Tax=Roridomyces roridus TaxID=1738132 RepID=A0AAD7FNA6_9AGAR|nr:hypothetical protein FB45DRAFT_1027355 [Roridomyces roridus]